MKTEFNMEASYWIKVFCRNIWLAGKEDFLGKMADTEMVGYFEDRLGETHIYPKFDHLLYALMGSVSKALMYELSREVVSHAVYV